MEIELLSLELEIRQHQQQENQNQNQSQIRKKLASLSLGQEYMGHGAETGTVTGIGQGYDHYHEHQLGIHNGGGDQSPFMIETASGGGTANFHLDRNPNPNPLFNLSWPLAGSLYGSGNYGQSGPGQLSLDTSSPNLSLNPGVNLDLDIESILLPIHGYRHDTWAIAVLVVAYLAILCVGVVGNFTVILTVYKTMRMRTVTNFFILNLALADLFVCIFCLPPTLVANIYVPWVLGWFMCKTVPYFQGVTVCASVYSLVAISLDRFLAIWFPLRCQITKKKARLVIFCIWFWSLTLALPWLFFFDLQPADPAHPQFLFCVENWPKGIDENMYYLVVNLGLFYLIPLFIISVCYFFIWLRVWRRQVPQDSHLSQIELIHQRAKVGVLKMLIVVVVCFAFCWLPLYIIFSRYRLSKTPLTGLEEDIISIVMPIAQVIGTSNSAINPLLYGFLNVKFRRAFIRLFRGHQWTRNATPHYDKGNVLDAMTLRKLHSRLQATRMSNTEMQRV